MPRPSHVRVGDSPLSACPHVTLHTYHPSFVIAICSHLPLHPHGRSFHAHSKLLKQPQPVRACDIVSKLALLHLELERDNAMTAQGVDDAAGRSQVEQLWCDACALLQEWDCQCNPEETLVSSQFGRIFIEVARRTQGNSCFAPAPPPSLQLSEYLHSIRHISQILSLCDLLLRMCSEGRVKYIAHQLALLYQALVSAKLPLDEARISIEACIPPALPPLAQYYHSSCTSPPLPPPLNISLVSITSSAWPRQETCPSTKSTGSAPSPPTSLPPYRRSRLSWSKGRASGGLQVSVCVFDCFAVRFQKLT